MTGRQRERKGGKKRVPCSNEDEQECTDGERHRPPTASQKGNESAAQEVVLTQPSHPSTERRFVPCFTPSEFIGALKQFFRLRFFQASSHLGIARVTRPEHRSAPGVRLSQCRQLAIFRGSDWRSVWSRPSPTRNARRALDHPSRARMQTDAIAGG